MVNIKYNWREYCPRWVQETSFHNSVKYDVNTTSNERSCLFCSLNLGMLVTMKERVLGNQFPYHREAQVTWTGHD